MIDLRLGDCLKLMADMPDGSIDLVLSDLPYGTTANCWDQIIPLEPLWEHYRRLLKPRGAVVLMASQPFTSMLVTSNLEWFKYCLVWEKNRLTTFYNVNFQPGKRHEDIAIFSPAAASFSRRGNMIYNPQLTVGEPWRRRDVSEGRPHTFHADPKAMTRESDGGRLPGSVLRFACEYDFHPTQKPVALMEYLIRTYSNEDDTVLDNACGSASTLVACLNTNRHGFGIEKSPEIYATARTRLDDEIAKTCLFDLEPSSSQGST